MNIRIEIKSSPSTGTVLTVDSGWLNAAEARKLARWLDAIVEVVEPATPRQDGVTRVAQGGGG